MTANAPLVSTSALARQLDLPAKALFELLVEKGWIQRVGDQWKLTSKGQFEGGDYVTSKKYGEYVSWPESVLEHAIFAELFNRALRTRVLGSELGISAHRFNALLADLGWQRKHHRGWTLTEQGRQLGGEEKEDSETGVPYSLWPRTLLDNSRLKRALQSIAYPCHNATPSIETEIGDENNQQALDFESEKCDLKTASLDGHIPESPEDLALCNWFYLMNVSHAYRRELPDQALGCCDFYLPVAQLYIESWHASDKQLSEKLARLEYYKDNKLPFFEISASDLENLDTVLPKRLLKYDITVY